MTNYYYTVTCSYDGKVPHFAISFDNALDAVNSYRSFSDWGFADEFATVNLSEPSGKMHTKNLYRKGLVTTK